MKANRGTVLSATADSPLKKSSPARSPSLRRRNVGGARWLGASFQLITADSVNPADYKAEPKRD